MRAALSHLPIDAQVKIGLNLLKAIAAPGYGAVCVWDVKDPTRTTSPQLALRGHKGEINALAKLDGGRLASGGGIFYPEDGESDNTIRIWNVSGGILEAATPIATLEGHSGTVQCLAALDDDRLASGSWDHSIIIWNLADGAQLAKLEGHTEGVLSLAALDGDRLASGSNDKSVIIWNLEDGTQLAKLEGHTNRVRALAALDGNSLASGGGKYSSEEGESDNSIIIWNLADGTRLATLEGHSDMAKATPLDS